MDPTISGVDELQNTGAVIAENEVTAALDAVLDCINVSAGVDPSTALVELQVNIVQCLLCCCENFDQCCLFCCKGELL